MSTDRHADAIFYSQALFADGYCCAESVLLALARYIDRDPGMLSALANGFCGGIDGTQTCGAISGAIMGIGLVLGPIEPHADHSAINVAAREFIRRFLDEFGSLACHDLLNGHVAPEARQPHATCTQYVGEAVRLALEVLEI